MSKRRGYRGAFVFGFILVIVLIDAARAKAQTTPYSSSPVQQSVQNYAGSPDAGFAGLSVVVADCTGGSPSVNNPAGTPQCNQASQRPLAQTGTGYNPVQQTNATLAAPALPPLGSYDQQAAYNPNTSTPPVEPQPIESSSGTKFDVSGAVDVGARFFYQDPLFPGQTNDPALPFIGGWLKSVLSWREGDVRLTVQPYGRYDIITRRDLFDIAEGNIYLRTDYLDVILGIHTTFWGVTESRHLVDVVNQIDLTGDVDEEDRLGQPLVNINLLGNELGTLSLFGLFGFREQNFPELIDRLRGPIPVSENLAVFSEDGLTRHVAFAARYFNTINLPFGSADFAVSYFNGLSRSPLLVATPTPGGLLLIPLYDRINQFGAELLVVNGDLQLKAEGLYADQFGEDVFAVVGGFEYTRSDVFGSGVDVGVLGEFLFDDRSNVTQPVVLGDNDVFAGFRVTPNNSLNTQFLAGMTYDIETDEIFASVEFSSRITDHFRVALEARFFENIPAGAPAAFLRREDFINLTFTGFF